MGRLAGECGHSGAQALRAPPQLSQGGSAVPAKVVLLQVCKNNTYTGCVCDSAAFRQKTCNACFFVVLFFFPTCLYSSMVIRDLTLRSAASFGSFHLIRLLYDEYMFYLVEHRVAQATGETPIGVMGEVGISAQG